MLTFGLGIGGLLVVIGLVTYVLAPLVGPNPIFGVRVGYSYASREIWDRTNRAGGALMAIVGIAVALAALGLQQLNVAPGTGMPVLTALLMIALLASVAWMFVYARGLAQGTELAKKIAPARFQWAYIVPVIASFLVLVVLAAYLYPSLPADRLATHFDLQNRPDGWSTRDGFMSSFLGIAGIFLLLDIAVVLLATREPLVAFGRWGASWQLDPERGLIFTGIAFALTNVILMAAMLDVGWFNTRGLHLFEPWLLLGMAAAMVLFFVALFFMLGRRVSPQK